MEYDESVILRYDHRFMSVRLAEGEFIRDTATVNIIDNDCKVYNLIVLVINSLCVNCAIFSCCAECGEIIL